MKLLNYTTPGGEQYHGLESARNLVAVTSFRVALYRYGVPRGDRLIEAGSRLRNLEGGIFYIATNERLSIQKSEANIQAIIDNCEEEN